MHSVLGQLTKEEPLAQSARSISRNRHGALLWSTWFLLLIFFFFLIQSFILESHLIKELVGVDGQLVDDLLDHWLHLHEGVDTTTDLLVDQVLQESHDLCYCYLAVVFIIEEGEQEASILEGDGLAEASDDLAELRQRDEP